MDPGAASKSRRGLPPLNPQPSAARRTVTTTRAFQRHHRRPTDRIRPQDGVLVEALPSPGRLRAKSRTVPCDRRCGVDRPGSGAESRKTRRRGPEYRVDEDPPTAVLQLPDYGCGSRGGENVACQLWPPKGSVPGAPSRRSSTQSLAPGRGVPGAVSAGEGGLTSFDRGVRGIRLHSRPRRKLTIDASRGGRIDAGPSSRSRAPKHQT